MLIKTMQIKHKRIQKKKKITYITSYKHRTYIERNNIIIDEANATSHGKTNQI